MRTFWFGLVLFIACTGCEDTAVAPPTTLEVPTTYSFSRDGRSSVNFSGQTLRIGMAEELIAALTNPSSTALQLENMFRNAGPDGEAVAPFTDPALNGTDKSLRSKVAASADLFGANATGAGAVRADFDGWIEAQVSMVFPRWMEVAAPGQAGQIAAGTRTYYVDPRGLELNQVVAKAMIGALMLDQSVNNYLSPTLLDAGRNREDNDAGTVVPGTNFTAMEHYWDEAYGYLAGLSADPAAPLVTLGSTDQFLNEYLERVAADPDFAGIADDVFQAYLRGRAAIVAGQYDVRDQQAARLQRGLSLVMAIRAVYYLDRGAASLENEPAREAAFHGLSEGYGFVYALQFTRDPATGSPYFSRSESQALLEQITGSDKLGFWTVEPDALRDAAAEVARRFDFSYVNATN